MELAFTSGATGFLAAARPYLAAEPVLSTVVSTLAERQVTEAADGVTHPAWQWFLTVRDGGRVVGAAMRTAEFGARPAYVLPMPMAAARAVAAAVHARGEELTAVSGVESAAVPLLTEIARRTGGTVVPEVRTRLFELGTLVPPRGVPGRLRPATPAELDLAHAWFTAFPSAGDRQAGREPRDREPPDRANLARRIERGRILLWENVSGEVVHLTGINPPALGVARIGPVYTPPEHRGHGYAAAAVAEASRRLSADGARVTLFTDLANPESNRLYRRLGYLPVADMVELVLRR